jgi:hypothetical protein
MPANNEDSVVYSMLDRLRAYMDDPSVDAKYNDAFLVKHVLPSATSDVVARLNHTNSGQIILKHQMTLQPGEERHALPPNIGEVRRLITTDGQGTPIYDLRPRNLMHPFGEGWRVEGTPARLYLVTPGGPSAEVTVELWYVPNGEPRLLFGTATVTVSPAPTVATASVVLGNIDRRESSYAGAYFRWIPDRSVGSQANEAVAEELISSSVFNAGVVTFTPVRPLVHGVSVLPATRDFEVVPMQTMAFQEAAVLSAALKLSTMMKVSQNHRESLRVQYLTALKTASDNLTFIQTRTGHSWHKDTVDNEDQQGIWRTVGFISGTSV